MFKRNQILKSLVIAGVALTAGAAMAQETETTTASVVVQNAFVLTETAPLSFGTITARSVSGAADATLVMGADGVQGALTAPGDNVRVLTAGSAAGYTVAGAAPFTALTINVSEDTATLSNASAPSGNPDFTISAFTATDGTNDLSGITSASNGTLTTDVNGELTIGVGATLTLADQGDEVLIDGTYEGQFTLEVAY